MNLGCLWMNINDVSAASINISVRMLIKTLDICKKQQTTIKHKQESMGTTVAVSFSFSLTLWGRHLWVNGCQPGWWRALVPLALISLPIKAASTLYFHLLYFSGMLRHGSMSRWHHNTQHFPLKHKNLDGKIWSKLSVDLGGCWKLCTQYEQKTGSLFFAVYDLHVSGG